MAEKLFPQDQKLDNRNETEVLELIGVLKTWAQENRTPTSYGSNGLVFRMEASETPESLRRVAKPEKVVTDTAVKTLKIFKPEAAKREYDMLLRAHGIVSENQRQDEKIAFVPRPINNVDITLDEDIRTYLNSRGSRLDKSVGIISMDFIEGVDLATFLYRNFMLLKGYPPQDIDSLDFTALHSIVSQELGLLSSKERVQNPKEDIMERNMIQVRKFLKKNGFILNASILEKINNTINLFRKNNLYHNDLHERNIMLTPDNHIFIIDFGHASIGPVEKEDWEDKLLDDYGVTKRLAQLTKSPETDLKEEQEKAYAELSEMKEILPKTAGWKADFEKLKSLIAQKPEIGLENYFILISSQDNKVRDFLVMLILICEDGKEKKAEIINFINSQIANKRNRPFLVNQFKTLRGYLNIGL